jgi:hypothetical protein
MVVVDAAADRRGLTAWSATLAAFAEENAVLYCAASESSLDEAYLERERRVFIYD